MLGFQDFPVVRSLKARARIELHEVRGVDKKGCMTQITLASPAYLTKKTTTRREHTSLQGGVSDTPLPAAIRSANRLRALP